MRFLLLLPSSLGLGLRLSLCRKSRKLRNTFFRLCGPCLLWMAHCTHSPVPHDRLQRSSRNLGWAVNGQHFFCGAVPITDTRSTNSRALSRGWKNYCAFSPTAPKVLTTIGTMVTFVSLRQSLCVGYLSYLSFSFAVSVYLPAFRPSGQIGWNTRTSSNAFLL